MGEGHQGREHQGGIALAAADLTAVAFRERRGGWAKAVLHEQATLQMSVLRIRPSGDVPAHAHSEAHDLFIGVRGELEVRSACGAFVLRPGGFCSIPPGVPHEVRNRSDTEDAYLVLVHTPYEHFDLVEC